LYRLPEVRSAVALGLPVIQVEGEKDADNLAALGFCATTAPHGAKAPWLSQYSEALRGGHVVSIPDKDEIGRAHARKVRKALRGVAASVTTIELPGPGKDVTDWIAAGGTKAELLALIAAPPSLPEGWIGGGALLAKKFPTVDWVLPGILSKPSLSILSGESGVWKSWLGTDLAASMVLGGSFVGQFPVNGSRAMLVTADEDEAEVRRKLAFLTARNEPGFEEVLERGLKVWAADLDFDDEAQFGPLEDAIELFRPDIVLVDHLRVCFGGNENDSEFARNVKKRAKAMIEAHPCCVLWFHHWNKPSKEGGKRPGDRLRGTGGLRGIADHHIAIERSPDGVGTFIVDKNRKGREPAPWNFVPQIDETVGVAQIVYQCGDVVRMTGAMEPVVMLLRAAPGRTLLRQEIITALPRNTGRQIDGALDRLHEAKLVSREPDGSAKRITLLEPTP